MDREAQLLVVVNLRQFSLRLVAHLAHCPFKVRIETAEKVKCYVRDD